MTAAVAMSLTSKHFAEGVRAAKLCLVLKDKFIRRHRADSKPDDGEGEGRAGALLPNCGNSQALVSWESYIQGVVTMFPRTASLTLVRCNIDHFGLSTLIQALPHLEALAVSKCFAVRGDVLLEGFDALSTNPSSPSASSSSPISPSDDDGRAPEHFVLSGQHHAFSGRAQVMLLGDLPHLHATVALPNFKHLVCLGLTNANLLSSTPHSAWNMAGVAAANMGMAAHGGYLHSLPFICKLAAAVTGGAAYGRLGLATAAPSSLPPPPAHTQSDVTTTPGVILPSLRYLLLGGAALGEFDERVFAAGLDLRNGDQHEHQHQTNTLPTCLRGMHPVRQPLRVLEVTFQSSDVQRKLIDLFRPALRLPEDVTDSSAGQERRGVGGGGGGGGGGEGERADRSVTSLVVDLTTSPVYTLREAFGCHHHSCFKHPTQEITTTTTTTTTKRKEEEEEEESTSLAPICSRASNATSSDGQGAVVPFSSLIAAASEAKDRRSYTPLHAAAATKDTSRLAWLLFGDAASDESSEGGHGDADDVDNNKAAAANDDMDGEDCHGDNDDRANFISARYHGVGALGDRKRRVPRARTTSFVKDARGCTALYRAAEAGNAQCCLLLLAAGEDPLAKNHRGENAIYVAALKGHVDALHVLVRSPKAVQTAPVEVPAMNFSPPPPPPPPPSISLRTTNLHVKVSAEREKNCTAGEGASDRREAQDMLAVVDSKQPGALACAVHHSGEMAKFPLPAPPLIPSHLTSDAEGFSPLHCAVLRRSPEALRELLVAATTYNPAKKGDLTNDDEDDNETRLKRPLFDVNGRNKYLQTPLHLAVLRSVVPASSTERSRAERGGRTDVSDVHVARSSAATETALLSRSATAMAATTNNAHSAADKPPIAVQLVELLLAAGADVNALDDCGATPLDLLVRKLNAMDILRDGERADFDRATVLNDLLQCLQFWGARHGSGVSKTKGKARGGKNGKRRAHREGKGKSRHGTSGGGRTSSRKPKQKRNRRSGEGSG